MTNNSSEPILHSELEDNISPLSTLTAPLDMLFLLSLFEICISWKYWSSFSVFLLFLFFTNNWNFLSIIAFSSLFLFQQVLNLFLFFCLCLSTIACRSLQSSVEWLHLLWRMQYFHFGRRSTLGSSLDSTTLEPESSCFLLFEFFFDFLAAAEDFSFLLNAPSFLP